MKRSRIAGAEGGGSREGDNDDDNDDDDDDDDDDDGRSRKRQAEADLHVSHDVYRATTRICQSKWKEKKRLILREDESKQDTNNEGRLLLREWGPHSLQQRWWQMDLPSVDSEVRNCHTSAATLRTRYGKIYFFSPFYFFFFFFTRQWEVQEINVSENSIARCIDSV